VNKPPPHPKICSSVETLTFKRKEAQTSTAGHKLIIVYFLAHST
jgi:hypothetical protein